MADFLDEKRREIQARLKELKPLVEEYRRLEAAEQALSGVGTTTRATTTRSPRKRRSGAAGGGGGGTAAGAGRRARAPVPRRP